MISSLLHMIDKSLVISYFVTSAKSIPRSSQGLGFDSINVV